MILKILIENTKPEGSDLIAGMKFIFDCGQSGAAIDNAKVLGVDLRGIKFAVLSHSHYDHAGGFPKLLDFAPIEKIYTGENFWLEKFSRTNDGFKYRGCGFDEKFLAEKNIAQEICRDVLKLEENIWLVGNFKRRYDFETIPNKFVRGNKKNPDDFSDEIILVLREGDGLAIVTACAHSGILRKIFSADLFCDRRLAFDRRDAGKNFAHACRAKSFGRKKNSAVSLFRRKFHEQFQRQNYDRLKPPYLKFLPSFCGDLFFWAVRPSTKFLKDSPFP